MWFAETAGKQSRFLTARLIPFTASHKYSLIARSIAVALSKEEARCLVQNGASYFIKDYLLQPSQNLLQIDATPVKSVNR